jgi:hypothetical protein
VNQLNRLEMGLLDDSSSDYAAWWIAVSDLAPDEAAAGLLTGSQESLLHVRIERNELKSSPARRQPEREDRSDSWAFSSDVT